MSDEDCLDALLEGAFQSIAEEIRFLENEGVPSEALIGILFGLATRAASSLAHVTVEDVLATVKASWGVTEDEELMNRIASIWADVTQRRLTVNESDPNAEH